MRALFRQLTRITAWLALCASLAGMFRRPSKTPPPALTPPAFSSRRPIAKPEPSLGERHPRGPTLWRACMLALLVGGVLGSALLTERGEALQRDTSMYTSATAGVGLPASFRSFDFELEDESAIYPPAFKQNARLGERLANRPDFIWPVENGWVTDLYDGEHAGVDVGFEHSPPVRAARDGVVSFVGGEICCGKGLHVILWHDGGWSTLYGHLDSFSVKVGDMVRQGDEIGIGGNTGNSTGPHVHLELYQGGLTVDPMLYFPSDIEIRLEPDATETPTVTETPGEDEPEATPTPREPRRPPPTSEALPSATLSPPTPPKPTPVPTAAAIPSP